MPIFAVTTAVFLGVMASIYGGIGVDYVEHSNLGGNHTQGIAVNNDFIWIADSQVLTKYDMNLNLVDSMALPYHACDPCLVQSTLYVPITNYPDSPPANSISIVDADRMIEVSRISLDIEDWVSSISWDGKNFWVSTYNSHNIHKYSLDFHHVDTLTINQQYVQGTDWYQGDLFLLNDFRLYRYHNMEETGSIKIGCNEGIAIHNDQLYAGRLHDGVIRVFDMNDIMGGIE